MVWHLYTQTASKPSIVIAGSIWKRPPRLRRLSVRGVYPTGAQPVRRAPSRLSRPDSSQKTNISTVCDGLLTLYRWWPRRSSSRWRASMCTRLLDQSHAFSALEIVDIEQSIRQVSARKHCISSRYRSGFSIRRLFSSYTIQIGCQSGSTALLRSKTTTNL